jgi:hypothetical protein
VLLAVAPTAADYEAFERLGERHSGSVVMVNGRLEDAAVGIGSVARERRRGFVATWTSAYALIPVDGGALRQATPGSWELYRSDRCTAIALSRRLSRDPMAKRSLATLSGDAGSGVAGTLRAVDALIGGPAPLRPDWSAIASLRTLPHSSGSAMALCSSRR